MKLLKSKIKLPRKIRLHLLLILILIFLSACQSLEYREYDKDGKLLKECIKSGVPDWSNNKTISPHFSGMGI